MSKCYCGCCGMEEVTTNLFCHKCSKHIKPIDTNFPYGAYENKPHNRTYFAQFGKECPYSTVLYN